MHWLTIFITLLQFGSYHFYLSWNFCSLRHFVRNCTALTVDEYLSTRRRDEPAQRPKVTFSLESRNFSDSWVIANLRIYFMITHVWHLITNQIVHIIQLWCNPIGRQFRGKWLGNKESYFTRCVLMMKPKPICSFVGKTTRNKRTWGNEAEFFVLRIR